jgi:triosephosphate isomerase
MASRPLIVANWKLHKTIPKAVRFAMDLVKAFEGKTEADIVLGPPYTALRSVKEVLKGSAISWRLRIFGKTGRCIQAKYPPRCWSMRDALM